MNLGRLLSLVPLLALLAVPACSSSSSSGGGDSGAATTPCNQNPWVCPSTQTCWPTSTTAFACLNAGPGQAGSSCVNTPGSPTCGAGLLCLMLQGASGGVCLPYCSTTDPSHACTGGALCEGVTFTQGNTPDTYVCAPQMTPQGDAGGTDAGGGGDASGGSDAPVEASGD